MTRKKQPEVKNNADTNGGLDTNDDVTNDLVTVEFIGSVQFEPGKEPVSGKKEVSADVAEQLIEAGLAKSV